MVWSNQLECMGLEPGLKELRKELKKQCEKERPTQPSPSSSSKKEWKKYIKADDYVKVHDVDDQGTRTI